MITVYYTFFFPCSGDSHKLADQNNFVLSNVSYVFSETFCSGIQKLKFEMGLDLGNILELYVEISGIW
ncbi:hypothetical protein CMV_015574 [Castanea mollissima]|uniref:Uncharacterized protein n=1 Tax=Castanea mollissima TaxID=60419 RepID=A0A8J4QUC2_9ROSI|nr:hypothetical protein CMV_015574 [Castanea mollissima]